MVAPSENSSNLLSIWNEKGTKSYLITFVCIAIFIFSVFKYFYPFPHFGIESDALLNAANGNSDAHDLSYGYILFLRLFPFITKNDIGLVLFQYCILQVAVLYLFCAIYFILNPNKWVSVAIFTILLINPLFINISNLITADSLFIALSICWFSNLIHIIHRATIKKIILNGILLCLCNLVNINSIWYILISLGTIIFGPLPNKKKLRSILVIILFPILAFICTSNRYNRIFPSSLGWEMAGNALYAYYYMPPVQSVTLPSKFRELHSISNNHMDSLRSLWIRPDTLVGNYYERDEQSPLRIYLTKKKLSSPDLINKLPWLNLCYGAYLISKHPETYLKHFVWPNLIFYYTPTPESLLNNNRDVDTISTNIQQWFNFKEDRLQSWNHNGRIPFMSRSVPIAFGIIKSLFFIFLLYTLLVKKELQTSRYMKLTFSLVIVSSLFSIFLTPVTIRNQTFLITIVTISDLLLMAAFVKHILNQTKNNIIVNGKTNLI